jgi:sulfinoalanine decarboxylase/sulfinoalanine decarboxylase/aspartate 1-decarboxylase
MEKDLALFNKLATLLLAKEKEEPVAKIIPPNEMYNLLDISLEDGPASEAFFEEVLEKIVLSTPRTASNQFFNQLFGGRISKATLGDLLAVLLNNSMYTYKVAGPQVGIEKEILHKICNMIGYGSDNDGTFAPGGSMSNYMAMLMARDAFNSNIINNGVQQKMTLYTSKESHYSIPKNATFMGIGRNQVRYVPTDSYGRMIPANLKSS